MKKPLILLIAITAFMFSACNSSTTTEQSNSNLQSFDTTKLKAGDVFYQCEMHPEVLSDKAGTCSKCGMDLMKIEKK